MRYLHEILASGRIVDNRQYRYRSPYLTSPSWKAPLEVRDGNKGKSAVCAFLQGIAAATSALDRSSDVFIIRPDNYEHNTDDPFLALNVVSQDNFTLTTGNLVGWVTGGGSPRYTINVSSRFGDEFLKYIIADADGFAEAPDLGGYAKGDLHWLLPYLWSVKMRKAWRKGLPKLYTTHIEATNKVRGRIDPVSHFYGGEQARYQCTVREHSYDNLVTRLLARTMQVLDAHVFLPNASQIGHTLQAATLGIHHPIQELLSAPPVRNPYFNDYNPLITLSKLILRTQVAGVGSRTDANALLFDVSMLFEYFIRKLLRRNGCVMRGKNEFHMAIPVGRPDGRKRRLIPDLVIESDGMNHVFDVKYKSFDFHRGVAREDVFQLHTYVSQVAANGPVGSCGFVYPISERRWNEEQLDRCGGVIIDTFRHGAQDLPFRVFFLKVPQRETCPESEWPVQFRHVFKTSCEAFVASFMHALKTSPAALENA